MGLSQPFLDIPWPPSPLAELGDSHPSLFFFSHIDHVLSHLELLHIQSTLERHRIELCEPTYKQIFFSINRVAALSKCGLIRNHYI